MIEKLKSIQLNYAALAFLAYLIKLLAIGAGYPDALVIACLAGLCGYKMRMQLLQPRPVDAELKAEIQEIKNALSRANMAKVTNPDKKYF